MKPKMLIIFALIVTIPTATIIWLGISLTRSEQTAIKTQFNDILKQRLLDINGTVSKVIKDKEVQLLPLTEIKSVKVDELRKISRSNPLVNQIFILNDKRKLIYPSSSALDLNSSEQAFLDRTKDVWESGETFDTNVDENFGNGVIANKQPQLNDLQAQSEQQMAAPRQQGRQQSNRPKPQLPNEFEPVDDNLEESQQEIVDVQQTNFDAQSLNLYGSRSGKNYNSTLSNLQTWANFESVEPGEGWYTWFKGQGVHFILWKRNEANMLIGIELNRSRLISDIINALPTSMESKDQTIVLKNASSDLYQWGNYQRKQEEEAKAEISLFAPLAAWKLSSYSSGTAFTDSLGKAMIYNYTVGGGILGLLLALLCIYFYRENSRQLRESSTKVNFVNQVSHELKTPLTNIRMYAELLENRLDNTDDKSCRQLGVIVSESQRLSRLINNVLSFAKQEKNKLKLNIRDVSLDSVLDSVLEHFKPMLSKKQISSHVSKNAAETVKADTDALEQILGNLLSNVEKYVPAGGAVNIESSRSQNYTTVTVSDDGPGIPEGQKKQIFDAFHRISNKLSDGVSGTGIGLSISRELALMHGGDLTLLDSDKGAIFQLKLPNKGKT